jgi:hypothetical protein
MSCLVLKGNQMKNTTILIFYQHEKKTIECNKAVESFATHDITNSLKTCGKMHDENMVVGETKKLFRFFRLHFSRSRLIVMIVVGDGAPFHLDIRGRRVSCKIFI